MGSIQKRSGRYQAQVRRQGMQAVSRTFATKKSEKPSTEKYQRSGGANQICLSILIFLDF